MNASTDFGPSSEFFVGGVPPLTSFILEALELRQLVISTASERIGQARKIAELALIGITAQFEAFCKNQFAAAVNICPGVLHRFCSSRSDTSVPLDSLLTALNGITVRLGSLLAEKYDFGSARAVNHLYLDLLGITPFNSSEISEHESLIAIRNTLVHHGGVYSMKASKSRASTHATSGRPHLDSIVIGPEDFEQSAIFLERLALKITNACHKALIEALKNQNISLDSRLTQALEVFLEQPSGPGQISPPESYSVYESFELLKSVNGVDGRLELLQDARLDQHLRTTLWNGASIDSLPDDHYYWRLFRDSPPLPALVRIVERDGKLIEKMGCERPLAKCEKVHLYPNKFPTFMLTVDFSIGMGSYAGPATTFIEIANGAVRVVEALDYASKQREPIRLMRSLKKEWKLVPTHSGTEIFQVSCHPKWPQSAERMHFVVNLSRYQHDGTHWLHYQKVEDGFWESDQPFPDISLFP